MELLSLGALTPWLVLLHTPGIGAKTYQRLLARFGSPLATLQAEPATLHTLLSPVSCEALLAFRASPATAPQYPALTAVDRWLQQERNHLLTLVDAGYPELLLQIADPPPVLFVTGDIDCLQMPQLALVGARNPSIDGRENARAFAGYLAAGGFTITSGLAAGVDACAHQGALAQNAPTVAVLGTGLDRIYPARHRQLAEAVRQQGALVSEFPLGTPPRAGHFPRRNRIISGLSLGVLVIEAALKSGSLITARCALEQNREVFALPGSIHNPLSRGCHWLIKQGAKLVETGQDIVTELGGELASLADQLEAASQSEAEPQPAIDDPQQRHLLGLIGNAPTPVDLLVARSGWSPQEVVTVLLQLELNGWVRHGQGGYSRTPR